mmetsp:Transcript_27772/g.44753  ORF Transcript_27772/g.44753 Transcript_27772/m.44753 type:complete len:80 (-) Transcript_27772:850-1089(-)
MMCPTAWLYHFCSSSYVDGDTAVVTRKDFHTAGCCLAKLPHWSKFVLATKRKSFPSATVVETYARVLMGHCPQAYLDSS